MTISGLSTTSSKIGGTYNAGIATVAFSLAGVGTTGSGIGTAAATGIVTYFSVDGDLSRLRENDIIGIGTEEI